MEEKLKIESLENVGDQIRFDETEKNFVQRIRNYCHAIRRTNPETHAYTVSSDKQGVTVTRIDPAEPRGMMDELRGMKSGEVMYFPKHQRVSALLCAKQIGGFEVGTVIKVEKK